MKLSELSNASPRLLLRVGSGAVVVLLLLGFGIAVLLSAAASRGDTGSFVVAPSNAPTMRSATIYVHVLGAVGAPGLYELPEGSRVVDAIAAAGGFTDGADENQLNLARFVSDGEQIVVPLIGAQSTAGEAAVGGKVNINTADAAALDTLPRIGPSMAARIIDWREANGRFATIDELMSVTGIGDKTFEGLKDLITV